MFLGMPKAGARLHADSVCEPIFSVQLTGRKRWRLGPLPPYRRAMLEESTDYMQRWQKMRASGVAQPKVCYVCVLRTIEQHACSLDYTGKHLLYPHSIHIIFVVFCYSCHTLTQGNWSWAPTYDFILEPGEAIFFPPSWMHETENLAPAAPAPTTGGDAAAVMQQQQSRPGDDDGCSIAASLQWRYPFATSFIRDFAPRLARAAETHFCFEHWAPFISGDVDGVRKLARAMLRNTPVG